MEIRKGPLLLRVADAARLLSISRSQAYALVAKGEIPATRIGSSVRIPMAALEKLAAGALDENVDGDGAVR